MRKRPALLGFAAFGTLLSMFAYTTGVLEDVFQLYRFIGKERVLIVVSTIALIVYHWASWFREKTDRRLFKVVLVTPIGLGVLMLLWKMTFRIRIIGELFIPFSLIVSLTFHPFLFI